MPSSSSKAWRRRVCTASKCAPARFPTAEHAFGEVKKDVELTLLQARGGGYGPKG